mgnify:FL=1
MGPRSYERGITVVFYILPPREYASMGPRSYERGITGRALDSATSSCFNGAAFLRTRNQRYESGILLAGLVLQWGRVLTNAESFCREVLGIHPWKLQWGRVLTNAESAHYGLGERVDCKLQWGRVLTNAESQQHSALSLLRHSFNGAAFLRTRNPGWYDRT